MTAEPIVRDDREVRRRVAEVERLLAEVDGLAEPRARRAGLAAVQGVVELYGEALARVVAHLGTGGGDGGGGRLDLETLAADELIGHLLLVHDLHPRSVEERVAAALDAVRPRLAGAEVELLAVEPGAARLRVEGGGSCPSTAAALRRTVEEAVLGAAPEIERVAIETVPAGGGADFVPLARLQGSGRGRAASGRAGGERA